ncbi:pullulanase [Mycobacterium goodii]|nr:pullulanase [Mycolicibacterium goodii]PJK23447.1 pullulanase [Mycolicibacterium goodii]
MDYCLGDPDGTATMWTAPAAIDTDGDGVLDGVGLDIDGDGRTDDVLADLDDDGLADHLLRDLDDDGHAEAYYTDDGSGTWAVSVDRSGQIRWFGLDGAESTSVTGDLVDFDGDGAVDDRLVDADGDGLADQVHTDGSAHVDTDRDGRWDLKLVDDDGDGRADSAAAL